MEELESNAVGGDDEGREISGLLIAQILIYFTWVLFVSSYAFFLKSKFPTI